MPYQALVTALRPMAPLLTKSRIAPVWLAALAPLLPALAAHLPTASPELAAGRVPSDADVRRDGARLAEAFAVAFEELARARPLLVVLEDVHWSGAATIDALDALREGLAERRVLFLATYREDERGATSPLRALRRGDPIETISLARLPVSAIDELDGAPGIASALSREDLRLLYDRAEGHPLFLLDLIAHADDSENLPPAIEDAIERRLASVDPGAQLYLEIAATAGAAFDLDTIVGAKPLWLLLTFEGEELYPPFVADLIEGALAGVSITPFERVIVWSAGCLPVVFAHGSDGAASTVPLSCDP